MDTLTPLLCGLAAIVLVAIVLIANAIRIVPEYQRLVVFLGLRNLRGTSLVYWRAP